MKLTGRQKAAYGIGAIGKDMVYALSASYVMYYYQDIMGLSASFVGFILMIARVFDAVNDPFMGILVAKTQTKWGRFRPWLFSGTVLNAFVLYALFKAPSLAGTGLMVYFSVVYILWGMTYTMMDIPYWSMTPAFTDGGRERENLTTLARSCAGVGSALITIITMKCVMVLGAGDERVGFKLFSLIIAVLFIVFIAFACFTIKEKSTVNVDSPSVGQMFKALVQNDQAMTVVVAIVLINCSLYITSNLLIYFFKYDVAGTAWADAYSLFNAFGGGIQIISMMIFFPLLRHFISTTKVFYTSLVLAMAGYGILLIFMIAGIKTLFALFVP